MIAKPVGVPHEKPGLRRYSERPRRAKLAGLGRFFTAHLSGEAELLADN